MCAIILQFFFAKFVGFIAAAFILGGAAEIWAGNVGAGALYLLISVPIWWVALRLQRDAEVKVQLEKMTAYTKSDCGEKITETGGPDAALSVWVHKRV